MVRIKLKQNTLVSQQKMSDGMKYFKGILKASVQDIGVFFPKHLFTFGGFFWLSN
jgi:hypothetical protein